MSAAASTIATDAPPAPIVFTDSAADKVRQLVD